MPKRTDKKGSELFIVDNSDDDWKTVEYLREWCPLSESIDIATGFFEIGAFLSLKEEWQKVDSIRILMGDEVSKRTKSAWEKSSTQNRATLLDESIEREKEKNSFLTGVPAIVEAIRSGRIHCRVYRKGKFHAKAYITHARLRSVGSVALVGSSNFTYPGLTENIELNVKIDGTNVAVLQDWYEQHWEDAEEITPDILRVLERQTKKYLPFDVYVRALYEYCRGHELTANEWETTTGETGSQIYPILDQYQKEGYQSMIQIANRYGGAFLCDGVGLGKTFIGLMLIERLIMHEGKKVVLFVPKTARVDVWERAIERYLPHIGGTRGGDFSSLVIFNHTDLGRGGVFSERFKRIKNFADAIIIDEAHHFRNPGRRGDDETKKPSRYRQLFDLVEGRRGKKNVFMLTATPVNNSLHDFRHMAELFTRGQEGFLRSCGFHHLTQHFVKLEKELQHTLHGEEGGETTQVEADTILTTDTVFRELVVQRSRAYVKRSQELQASGYVALFPKRECPEVVSYSVKKTYGKLLKLVDDAFQKEQPLFILGIYYPSAYSLDKETIDPTEENRQKQVCGLIRTLFLKRFESSANAFEQSCHRLLKKLLAWSEKHVETHEEKKRLDRFLLRNAEILGIAKKREQETLFSCDDDENDAEEDFVTPEMLEDVKVLNPKEYNIPQMLLDTSDDMEQIVKFLGELQQFEPKHDDKLKALIHLLKSNVEMKTQKVLVFTEFAETARYLKKQLDAAGITGIEQIDSGRGERAEIIRRFAPYYNESSSAELYHEGKEEIRILLSTDVLSEGLNLQDCTLLINYDIHWNPVRLMQRIGRVDRRMNPQIEERLCADHPDRTKYRGKVKYWNFLPPDELNELLSLYRTVSQKTLKISKTLGIEGKQLLTPEDDYDALKNFNESFDGETTSDEKMRLELQRLFTEEPELEKRIMALPGRVFSGRRHPAPGTQAVFFCYWLPSSEADDDHDESGTTKWLLYRLEDKTIIEEPAEIIKIIRTEPNTPRHCEMPHATLDEIRVLVERHIKNAWLRQIQALAKVKPILKAWMKIN